MSGTVIAINEDLASTPERINQEPFGTGWIFKVSVSEQPTGLLDAAAYGDLTA